MLALLRASHPQPAAAVTAITVAIGLAVGRGSATWWVGFAALAGQLSVGWSNDYLDRDRDRRAGRLDKPIASAQVAARTVGLAALVAAVACVPLSLLAGFAAGLVHLAAVAAAYIYNARLKGTIASPLPYAVAFGALPAFVTLGLPGTPLPQWWAVVAAALLGTGAHFVNTLPDIDADVLTGVRGLPQRIGPRPSVIAAGALLGGAVTVAALAPSGGPVLGTALVLIVTLVADIAIVVLAWRHHTGIAWKLTMCLALLTVVLLIATGSSLVA